MGFFDNWQLLAYVCPYCRYNIGPDVSAQWWRISIECPSCHKLVYLGQNMYLRRRE